MQNQKYFLKTSMERDYPLRLLRTPNDLGPEIEENRKIKLKEFAELIFKELSKKHSLSYIRDVAVNFDIRRGIDLVFKENQDGTRVYQYKIGEKICYMNGEREIDFVAEVLMDIIQEKKREIEIKTGKQIIL